MDQELCEVEGGGVPPQPGHRVGKRGEQQRPARPAGSGRGSYQRVSPAVAEERPIWEVWFAF